MSIEGKRGIISSVFSSTTTKTMTKNDENILNYCRRDYN